MTRRPWTNTTHDWTASVDVEHLPEIRRNPGEYAPIGVLHLVFEVLAYAADEAASNGDGRATVTLVADGSVRVVDDGRGTDTRRNDEGLVVRKPVMVTPDLRFFDHPSEQSLPDGHPRRESPSLPPSANGFSTKTSGSRARGSNATSGGFP